MVILYGSPQYCYPHFKRRKLVIYNRVNNLSEDTAFHCGPCGLFVCLFDPGKVLLMERSRKDFGITPPCSFPSSFILQTRNWAMQPDRAFGLPLGVRNCQHVRISGTHQWFKRIKGWMVMKPGMTWKKGLWGLWSWPEGWLSRVQIRDGSKREQDSRLLGPKSVLLPGCVTLDKYLPPSVPPFTDWGTDTFL